MVHSTPEKRCGRCKKTKPVDQFSLCRSAKDGFQNKCKICMGELQRDRQVINAQRMSVAIPSEKYCSGCKRVKSADQFSCCRSNKDGLHAWCKVCQSEYYRKDHAKDPEKYRARSRAQFQKDPELYLRRSRARTLKRLYGITLDDYERLLIQQNGVCAICDRAPDGTGPNQGILRVDHDHETGAVRGLLCQTCNAGIGMLRDDPYLLARALRYLNRSRSRLVVSEL